MCLAPGTPITLADGVTMAVELVSPGTVVRTGKGLARAVRAVHAREYDDDLIRITCRGRHARLTVTERHALAIPVPVVPAAVQGAESHRRLLHGGVSHRSFASARPEATGRWLWRASGDLLSSDLLVLPYRPRGLGRVGRLERFPGRGRRVFHLELESEDASFTAGGILVVA